MRKEVAASPPAAHEEALVVHEHEPLRLADGQSAEERLVQEREDRGVRAHAEADGEDRHHREGAVAPEAPEGVSHVVAQPIEHGWTSGVGVSHLRRVEGTEGCAAMPGRGQCYDAPMLRLAVALLLCAGARSFAEECAGFEWDMGREVGLLKAPATPVTALAALVPDARPVPLEQRLDVALLPAKQLDPALRQPDGGGDPPRHPRSIGADDDPRRP